MAAEFALAANVIATISFTIQIWSESSEIRKNGSTITTQTCSRNALSLQRYCQNIWALQESDYDPALQGAKRIRDIAIEVSDYATTLADRLAKCQLPVDQEGWKRYQNIFSVLWNSMRHDADAQMKRLADFRQELQSELVISIWREVNLSDPKQQKNLQMLDSKLKTLIETTLKDRDSMRNGIDDVLTLGQRRHEEIMAEFRRRQAFEAAALPAERSEELRLQRVKYRIEELQGLLWYTGIERRYGAIAPAHKATFEWIFTGQQTTAESNTTLIEWMKESNGVYWVSGRAGTGKSSLMRFLDDDARTKEAFQTWAGDKPLVLASFYFWNSEAAGDDLLKGLAGLYRAVLFSLIRQDNRFAEVLFPNHLPLGRKWDKSFPSLLDMSQAFTRLTEAEKIPAAVGLMIDGLDEYDATQREQIEAAEMLCQASKSPNIKIIVSSRPEMVFETAFQSSKRLRLHELTRSDRRTYISDKLEAAPRLQMIAASREEQDELFELVLERSEGIFLWVRLAVATLLEEIGCAMNISKLKTVTEEIPSGSEELSRTFDHILRHRIPPEFRQRGLRLIETTRYGYTLPSMMIPGVEGLQVPYDTITALLYSFFEDDHSTALQRPIQTIEQVEVVSRTEYTANIVRRSCAGLLELRAATPSSAKYRMHDVVPKQYNDPVIRFLHKDVAVFLQQEETRRSLGDVLRFEKFCVQTNLLKCMLIMIKAQTKRVPSGNSIGYEMVWAYVEQCMRIARDASTSNAKLIASILNNLDLTMKSLFQAKDFGSTTPISRNLHWSTGFPVDQHHTQEDLIQVDLARSSFLSFAVEQDVFIYVDWTLKTNGRNALTKSGKPLLASACGTDPFWRLIPFTQPARMVRVLLANGADPNEEFDGASSWQVALNVARRSNGLSYTELNQRAEIFDLLLQAGADPRAQVKWTAIKGVPLTTYQRTAYDQIHLTFVQMESVHMPHVRSEATWSDAERQQMAEKGQELLGLVEELMKKSQRGTWELLGWNSFSLRSLRGRLNQRLGRNRRKTNV